MKKATYSFDYQVYDSSELLPEQDRILLEKAKEAVTGSHAPYSHYHVGAAVRLENGMIFQGSNQENMSFPAGLCAERVAVFAAMSAHPDVAVSAIAITAVAEDFEVSSPVPPCGMCRQAILEYEVKFSHPIRMILGGKTGMVYLFSSIRDLLPLAFHENGLARKSSKR